MNPVALEGRTRTTGTPPIADAAGATSLALESDVSSVRFVGPERAVALAKLGVRTVGDLIEYFPFRHEMRPKSVPIGDLVEGMVATLIGELRNVREGTSPRATISATLVDGTGRMRLRWFNSPHLVGRLNTGDVVRVTGKVEPYGDIAFLTNPNLEPIDDDADPFENDKDRFTPVYPASAELASRQIGKLVDEALRAAGTRIGEFLPESLRERRRLPPRATAILRYHHPTSADEVAIARARLAYDELLLCQIAVQRARTRAAEQAPGRAIVVTEAVDQRIRRRFPFTLTSGQDRATGEIRFDLARSQPMNRMLQADVGAGKTVVALYAALAAVANKRQAALIAPTEVLAAQHFAKTRQYLTGSRVRVDHLAGATPRRERDALLVRIAAGEVDLLIGTHAILEKTVRFRDLGLVIVDEQHKFGVAQRAALRAKGAAPHVLVLTATPIPRTLAMTFFGDLDVSIIDGAPPGRQPIVTRLVTIEHVNDAWGFTRSRLARGEQAYVVYPLVEESEALPLKAARTEVQRLSEGPLRGFAVELLHGGMKGVEKQAAMERFRNGQTRVLVATTVIEVGVDVPKATVMAVQHAERYGLSQLHQLRGRIGRGTDKSYCLLFTEKAGPHAAERLKILCETCDGFRIAEEDLRLRGPGELLGTRQHGMPAFRVADLVSDLPCLEAARDDAAALLRSDARLALPEHAALRKEVIRKYGRALKLIGVG